MKKEKNDKRNTDIGKKSLLGATSTDLDKIRLQTVAANDLDESTTKGVPNKGQSRSEMDNRTGEVDNDEVFDQGNVRSSAFFQKKEQKKSRR